MTTQREVVLAGRPRALAVWVQGEAHSIEEYQRQAHWEVHAGPGEEAVLGASQEEEGAWAEAAEVVRAGLFRRSDLPRPLQLVVTRAEGAARRGMEERVARHAADGPEQIDRRIEELSADRDSPTALDAEERCALKALRGDFEGLPAMTTPQERAEVALFEDEGGRATAEGEEDGGDRHDRAAVADALDAARR